MGGLLPFDAGSAHVIGEPLRVAPELGAAVGIHARGGAARGQAEHVHAHRHAAGVAIADLNVAIDHHGRAHETHGTHAYGVAELFELIFERGDLCVGVARADTAQASGLFAEHHRNVL